MHACSQEEGRLTKALISFTRKQCLLLKQIIVAFLDHLTQKSLAQCDVLSSKKVVCRF